VMIAKWSAFEIATATLGDKSPITQSLNPMEGASGLTKLLASLLPNLAGGGSASPMASTAASAVQSGAGLSSLASKIPLLGSLLGAGSPVAAASGLGTAASGAVAAGAAAASPIAAFMADLGPVAPFLFAFKEGIEAVPHDMPAIIHQGEMVVPAHLSDAIRSGNTSLGGFHMPTFPAMPDFSGSDFLDGARGGSSGNGGYGRGGDNHFHIGEGASVLDGRGFKQITGQHLRWLARQVTSMQKSDSSIRPDW
jgi:hypothetical protein